MTIPYSQLLFVEEGVFENSLEITHQSGNIFAGDWDFGNEGDRFKLTGVILPDRTVSIQLFEPSEERHFITGRLTVSGSTLQIAGIGHFFDDFNHKHPPYMQGKKMMASGYAIFTKVN